MKISAEQLRKILFEVIGERFIKEGNVSEDELSEDDEVEIDEEDIKSFLEVIENKRKKKG